MATRNSLREYISLKLCLPYKVPAEPSSFDIARPATLQEAIARVMGSATAEVAQQDDTEDAPTPDRQDEPDELAELIIDDIDELDGEQDASRSISPSVAAEPSVAADELPTDSVSRALAMLPGGQDELGREAESWIERERLDEYDEDHWEGELTLPPSAIHHHPGLIPSCASFLPDQSPVCLLVGPSSNRIRYASSSNCRTFSDLRGRTRSTMGSCDFRPSYSGISISFPNRYVCALIRARHRSERLSGLTSYFSTLSRLIGSESHFSRLNSP